MTDLNTLMHAAVDDERPDLTALLDGAARDGRRLRRRRRIGYVGAGLAVAAVVSGAAVGTAQLTGGTSPTELQPAASDSGIGLTTAAVSPRPSGWLDANPTAGASPGAPIGKHVVLDVPGTSNGTTRSIDAPIIVDAPGWTCTPYPEDDKTACVRGGRLVSVNWRTPAEAAHAAWGDWAGSTTLVGREVAVYDGGVYVAVAKATGAHGNLAITVQGGSLASVRAVAPYVSWR